MVETEENPGVGLEVAPEVDPEADPEDVPEVAPEVGGALAAEIPTIPSWKRTKNLTEFDSGLSHVGPRRTAHRHVVGT